MFKQDYLVVTFQETTMALYMEKVCLKDHKPGRLIPLPKTIDAGCGLAWATLDKNQEEWRLYLTSQNICYDQMVEVKI